MGASRSASVAPSPTLPRTKFAQGRERCITPLRQHQLQLRHRAIRRSEYRCFGARQGHFECRCHRKLCEGDDVTLLLASEIGDQPVMLIRLVALQRRERAFDQLRV